MLATSQSIKKQSQSEDSKCIIPKKILTCITEGRAAVAYKILTSRKASTSGAALFLTRHTGRRPYTTGPVATKSGVEYDGMVIEELRGRTGGSRPASHGCTPCRRLRCLSEKVGRDRAPREEPDTNSIIIPKHCTAAC